MAAAVLLACAVIAASISTASASAAVAGEIAETAPIESFETFLDRLMGAESGGQTRAKNPRSSALGTFQFLKSTFLEIARRHFPAEVSGLVDDKILELRTDRDFARRAAAAFCRDNIGHLKAQGLEPTFADLRLAFLLGPADAVRVLKAEPQTPAVQLLSPAVIKANPFMLSMSAADLRSKSIRDVERDRQELIALAPQPRQRPSARTRPAAREALPAARPRRKLQARILPEMVSALHTRKASAPICSQNLVSSPQHLFSQAAVIRPAAPLTPSGSDIVIG